MRNNVLGAVHGEPGCVRGFVREAGEYLGLHRAHMAREEELLFPLVERLLDDGADRSLAAELERGSVPPALREQILSLRRRAGLPRPPAA